MLLCFMVSQQTWSVIKNGTLGVELKQLIFSNYIEVLLLICNCL